MLSVHMKLINKCTTSLRESINTDSRHCRVGDLKLAPIHLKLSPSCTACCKHNAWEQTPVTKLSSWEGDRRQEG